MALVLSYLSHLTFYHVAYRFPPLLIVSGNFPRGSKISLLDYPFIVLSPSLILSISLAAHRSISPPFPLSIWWMFVCFTRLLSLILSPSPFVIFSLCTLPPFHSDLLSIQCPSIESDLWSLNTGRHGLSWGTVESVLDCVIYGTPLPGCSLCSYSTTSSMGEGFRGGIQRWIGQMGPQGGKDYGEIGNWQVRYHVEITVGSITSSQEPVEVLTYRPFDSFPSTVSILHRILPRGCHTRWEVPTYSPLLIMNLQYRTLVPDPLRTLAFDTIDPSMGMLCSSSINSSQSTRPQEWKGCEGGRGHFRGYWWPIYDFIRLSIVVLVKRLPDVETSLNVDVFFY